MTDQPTPTPPRTWWTGHDFVYLPEVDRSRPRPCLDQAVPGCFDDTQWGVELVPAPDLARLRAGWALLQELIEGADDHRCWWIPGDIGPRARALLDEGGEK